MQIKQFPDAITRASWRSVDVSLAPNELYDIGFHDTNPNIFVVQNPNEAVLKFGISKVPTHSRFEYKVEYSCTDVFGRPSGTNHLYVLNDSSLPVTFTVFSIAKDFDPSLLKGTVVKVNLDNVETRAVLQGQAEGFIMKVHDANVYAQAQAILNKLGATLSVKDSNTANVYSEAQKILTKLGTTLAVSDNNAANVYAEVQKLNTLLTEKKVNYMKSGTNIVAGVAQYYKYINFLSNDGEADMEVTFGTTDFILKPGEVLHDIHFSTNTSVTIPKGATYRIMGGQ